MASATFQLNIIPKRVLTKTEAAHYCGRSISRFSIDCPCHPLRCTNGDVRWDVHDLDAWINSLKAGKPDQEADDIVGRLG
jgi:hypothetical protein